jgi:indolepyruvate ferredoxin oxidoreductase beta subunit
MEHFVPPSTDTKPISIAIVAMGGQGGGVLADWIVAAAEAHGLYAQSTSVPGVAQRTGATIYYVEIVRRQASGRAPVLALMPMPGDVDIAIAAELMEAGRAILRGLVTPDRTTLIASSHRALATVEKQVPGDGIADGAAVIDAVGVAAKRAIVLDMAEIAEQSGGAISAALLGALAGADVLPLPRAAFEGAIRDGGVGIEASLRVFAAAFDRVSTRPVAPQVLPRVEKHLPELPASAGHPELDALLARIRRDVPVPAQRMAFAGVRRLVDYQDPAYAGEYLDRLKAMARLDEASGGADRGFGLTTEAARQIAVAMAYDDVIRVADLKTRPARFERVAAEVGAVRDQIVRATEFMHPRMEEVCGTLPARLGEAIEARRWLFKALDRLINRGRRVRTTSVRWFVPLYVVAGMRKRRRGTLRHKRETAHMEAWLARVQRHAPEDYGLAIEILKCRRLVKGYSGTHARGASKFDRVMAGAERVAGRVDAADWVRRLRQAALVDEEGQALDGALRTIETL